MLAAQTRFGLRQMGKRDSSYPHSLAGPSAVASKEGKWGALTLILAAQVSAMSVWFSSSAAIANIKLEQSISSMDEALLTSAVQIGFVVGTIVSALFSLSDRLDPRRLFSGCALVAALATLCLVFISPTGTLVVSLRFLTGLCMAGVYPVGMRMAATWASGDLGLLIGLLVGALTLGSASPHLLAATVEVSWQHIYLVASGSAFLAAILICFVHLGPNIRRATAVDFSKIAQSWRKPAIRKANIGYLGHMWELYAMWAWLSVFLHQSFAERGLISANTKAAWLTFIAIASGAIGSWLGGVLADRYGRTFVTIVAMAISGSCAAITGFLYDAPLILLVPVVIIWGISVITDSAQFSATVTELAEPSSVGTLLTAQTCAGFLLTLVSIQILPVVQGQLGWPGAFAMLALGPVIGCIAMARLRADPDARQIAGGKR
ncbi:MFS transporter [Agrobacterium leguminum]|uniref:MFS transporter n=1 Tax=Agrobacterium leguminum TaxID=2792015 RepID=A0A9X3KGS2_9HYPH|nr:MFS transporter [Agrobacterium leguminum]MCZ7911532.1 MFS transporter [Agrobacterium leguminum]